MFGLVPLQLVDTFLLKYHVGHALLALFVLSVVGTVPLGSRKVQSLTVLTFGLLFVVTPFSMFGDDPFPYLFLGIVLLVVAPILYAFADD